MKSLSPRTCCKSPHSVCSALFMINAATASRQNLIAFGGCLKDSIMDRSSFLILCKLFLAFSSIEPTSSSDLLYSSSSCLITIYFSSTSLDCFSATSWFFYPFYCSLVIFSSYCVASISFSLSFFWLIYNSLFMPPTCCSVYLNFSNPFSKCVFCWVTWSFFSLCNYT